MEQKLKMNSIYGDKFLVEKFQNELKTVEQQLCLEKIWNKISRICMHCRNNGYKSLVELYEELDNDLLKDMIYLLSKAENTDEIFYIIHLLSPRLYNYKFIGKEFVEGVIYYEALLMILEGEIPELVRVRIVSILAINESVKEILS